VDLVASAGLVEDVVDQSSHGSDEVVVLLVSAGVGEVVVQSAQVVLETSASLVVVVVLSLTGSAELDQSDQLAEAVPARPRARAVVLSNFMMIEIPYIRCYEVLSEGVTGF
jgi:hypothetical protein